jgi:hypothetical protein
LRLQPTDGLDAFLYINAAKLVELPYVGLKLHLNEPAYLSVVAKLNRFFVLLLLSIEDNETPGPIAK